MSWTRINVAKAKLTQSGDIKPGWNGEPEYVHLFATAKNSLSCVPNSKQVQEVLTKFKEAFPSPLYKISLSTGSVSYKEIDEEEVFKQ